MKKKWTIGIIMILFIILLSSAMFVVLLKTSTKDKEMEENPKDITMFASITDCEEYQNIPKMPTENGTFSKATDYGSNDWLINVTGSTLEEYQEYVRLLERSGFKKHSDNGEDAMEGYVYTASFIKDNLTYTVSHVIKQDCTYLVAAYNEELSPHLIYQDSYMDDVTPASKTKVHMLELHNNGNSFIIELRNGHFIIEDGGLDKDAPYLLDYLESLTPGDEKPIVEAWFITHAHIDHAGALYQISNDPSYIERIYLHGVYFVEPNTAIYDMTYTDSILGYVTARVNTVLKDENGEKAKAYRMHLGQRYYFCDVMIDVPLTLEQLVSESYYDVDFNDTSTWMMHHIEGQKFLHAGDSHHTGMRMAMEMYPSSYFELDVFAVLHHGINVWDYFTDYCTLKTVLYTNWRNGSLWNPDTDPILGARERNYHLQESCEEYVSRGDGTVVLTFPYKVGSYEIMTPFDWKYDGGIQDVQEYSSGK